MKTLLIIDDKKHICRFLRASLESDDIEVFEAEILARRLKYRRGSPARFGDFGSGVA